MDLNDLADKKARLEDKANLQIQEALNSMRSDMESANADVTQELNKIKKNVSYGQVSDETENHTPVSSALNEKQTQKDKPFIFFSYPMDGFSEQPNWVNPLRQVLVANNYLTYNPSDQIDEQFGQQDLPCINALPVKLIKSVCSILSIPEEVLLPFDAVWKIMHKASTEKDHYAIVFQSLWFLVRSNLIICDLTRKPTGFGTPHEILWAKQLNIPVIGLLPPSGYLSPFAHSSVTCLFSGNDLLNLLPIIRGYAS